MHTPRLRAWRLGAGSGRGACQALFTAFVIALIAGLAFASPASAQEPEPEAEAPSAEAPPADAPVEVPAEKPAEVPAETPAEAPAAAIEPASPPAAPPAPDLGAVIAHPDLDARTRLEMEILGRVNAIRAEHGLHALRLDNRLVAAAREHAVDMAHRNFCRHTGSDGTQSRDRMRRNGYPYNNWAGENILCSRDTAEAALGWWMNSTPHRKNLLHGHFTHIGVGVSMHGRWGPDMTLVFAAGDDRTEEPDVFKSFREGRVADWIAATREAPVVR